MLSFDDGGDTSTGFVNVGKKLGKSYPTILEILETIKEVLCDENYDFKYRLSNEASYDITGGVKDYWCPKGLEHAPCWVRCGVKRKALSKWFTKTLVFTYGDTEDIRPDDTIETYYERNKYDIKSLLYDMYTTGDTGYHREEYVLGRAAQELYKKYFEEDE